MSKEILGRLPGGVTVGIDHVADAHRHPTIEECELAGRGPSNYPGKPYESGGLPDTPEERARFEAYMKGHCWAVGRYVEEQKSYDTVFVRCCYGIWRDRGALPTIWPIEPGSNPPRPAVSAA